MTDNALRVAAKIPMEQLVKGGRMDHFPFDVMEFFARVLAEGDATAA